MPSGSKAKSKTCSNVTSSCYATNNNNHLPINPAAKAVQEAASCSKGGCPDPKALLLVAQPLCGAVNGGHKDISLELNGQCKGKNIRDALSMSVEMPDCIQPTEIDSAFVSIRRPQDEILWSVGKVVQDFHKRNHFHDAVIKAGNGEALAHRYVLSASSEWMREQILVPAPRDDCVAQTSTAYKQLVEIRVDNCLEAPAVCQIIDYMYTARCRLNYFNFYPIFQAATYFKMPTIIHAAQRLMTYLMADENLAIMLEIAEQAVKSEPLIRFVYRHWVEKFYNQIHLGSFIDWPYPRVYRLLVNDDIRVQTEMDVFTAAIRWLNTDRSGRGGYFTDLMKAVRWVYMSQDELVTAVEMEKQLIKNKEVKQLVTDAQWFKTCQEHKHNWKDYEIPSSRMINSPACRLPRPAEKSCHRDVNKKLLQKPDCTPRGKAVACPTMISNTRGLCDGRTRSIHSSTCDPCADSYRKR